MHRLHFLVQLAQHPSPVNLLTLALLGLVGLAACYLVSRVDLAILVCVGLFLQLFSGNWNLMHVPIPLDRVVLLLVLCALILKGPRAVSQRWGIMLRPTHIALLVASAWAAASGLIAGTLVGHLGFYTLLDRYGLVPFALFCLCPLFFSEARRRHYFLVTMVAIGLYLGITGIFEGVHVYSFLFPRFIANPNVGIHWGRARGPILESTGDGFCIFAGGTGAAVALAYWKSTKARALCYLTIAVDAAADFFTVTRAVWIGVILGAGVALAVNPKTRRILVTAVVVGAIAVGGLLAVSSSIRATTLNRAEQQTSVWDRENTDLAGLRIVSEKPLTGVGWENFIIVSGDYMLQQPDYPITGLGLEMHNVFLGDAAELGIPGLIFFLLALGGAVRWAVFGGRWKGLVEDPFRRGALAIVVCFLIIANLGPFTQASPNALLWVWMGIAGLPYFRRLRPSPRLAPRPAPAPAWTAADGPRVAQGLPGYA
jgi:putative inorganic carbon (HCO3(-)) transporter